MSSTDPREGQAAVQALFRELLLPLANRMRAEGKAFFPLHPDPQAASYYVNRARKTMTRADFEAGPGDSFDEFSREMGRLWSSQGHPDLVALAPRIADLARELRRGEDQSDEVSPFIYVMF